MFTKLEFPIDMPDEEIVRIIHDAVVNDELAELAQKQSEALAQLAEETETGRKWTH